MNPSQHIARKLEKIVQELLGIAVSVNVTTAPDTSQATYATNIALVLFGRQRDKQFATPLKLAEAIKRAFEKEDDQMVARVTVAAPGFINFTLKTITLSSYLLSLLEKDKKIVQSSKTNNKRYLVEYAHPNTHKEMHIGHMRTLITGEAIARLLEATGAEVFRANYQGDIGPHVAKAMYGVFKLLKEQGLTLEDVDSWDLLKKAQFLGSAYIRGNKDYEAHKEEIDQLNTDLYEQKENVSEVYSLTRKWSLEYYEDFYKRFDTTFDKLFFESEMVGCGKKIVRENIGTVFTEDNGAVIFPGEKYGLHTRVFITKVGNPTYEGKEMCNGFKEYEAFPFDQKIHIVGSEQEGYFQVVFKALELLDPDRFKGKQTHVSMGMVTLKGGKMSSRTGDILRVDWLLDEVKTRVESLMTEGRIEGQELDSVAEQIAIGAVKYSVLKVGTSQDATFDIEKSVSLDGDSGPYIQYAYARTQSVIRKAENTKYEIQNKKYDPQPEEMKLLQLLIRFPEVVVEASENLSPNTVCTYLFELAHTYNLFYQKLPILKALEKERDFRLALTTGVGKTLKQGLHLLGIQAPEKM